MYSFRVDDVMMGDDPTKQDVTVTNPPKLSAEEYEHQMIMLGFIQYCSLCTPVTV